MIMALLFCCSGKSEGLQSLWKDGSEDTARYESFRTKYASLDGFEQWKADGEYLMSSGFLSEFLAEKGDPKSRSVTLKRYWVGEGLGTVGFDRAFGSEWPEEKRDAAVPIVIAMIAFYQKFLQELPDEAAKEEIKNTIGDLERLKSYFEYITDPDDVEQSSKKNNMKAN